MVFIDLHCGRWRRRRETCARPLRAARRAATGRRALRIEPLETRRMLSVTLLGNAMPLLPAPPWAT